MVESYNENSGISAIILGIPFRRHYSRVVRFDRRTPFGLKSICNFCAMEKYHIYSLCEGGFGWTCAMVCTRLVRHKVTNSIPAFEIWWYGTNAANPQSVITSAEDTVAKIYYKLIAVNIRNFAWAIKYIFGRTTNKVPEPQQKHCTEKQMR